MSKMDNIIDKSILYITSVLDTQVDIKPLNKGITDLIPTFIGTSYRFYQTKLLDTDICLLESRDENGYTPAQMEKQMQIVQSKLNMPVVFLLENMASYNLNRLISKRVNFIVPEKQMFIPALLIVLKRQPTQQVQKEVQMPPFAAFIILYHLQKEILKGYTTQEIAQKFKVSYANVNRAVRWLIQNELLAAKGDKEKTLSFPLTGKALFEKALPLLPNPIESVGYTDESVNSSKACLSGINALSAYSMINQEQSNSYAFSHTNRKEANITLDKHFGENRIEIWRYDPIPLSENGIVDKLSLYLTLKENEDERIQIELEQVIDNITWLEE